MATKSLLLAIAIACLAQAIAKSYETNPVIGAKNPVGKCPVKDGDEPTYLADSADCGLFYECSGGEAFPKECMDGLCFDTTLNVCAFPSNNGTNGTEVQSDPFTVLGICPPRDGASPVFFPDSESCSIYYLCSNGIAIKNECPPGLYWNNDANTCDWDIDSNCNPAGNSTGNLSEIYSKQESVLPLTVVGTCPPRDTNVTIFLPDSESCSVYYLCSNGNPIKNECPPDMSWNNVAHICDWDIDADCTPAVNSTDNSTEINVNREIAFPLSAVGTCPPRDSNETTFLPDSQNCSIYYLCSNGNPIKNECPPEMSWNNVARICDWDIDADCTPLGNSTGNSTDVYLKRESVLPLSAVGTCPPRDTNVTIFLPDSQSCSVYYLCSNGNPIRNECPPEMSWNSVANICDWDIDSNCNLGNVSSMAYTAVGTCPPRDTNVTIFLPDSVNCTIYYICSNGKPFQASCTPGMAWNSDLNICDWELNVNCKKPSNQGQVRSIVGTCPAKDPPLPILLPDSDDCHLYYECSGGIPILNECPPDLEFNANLMVCDFPLDAGCSIPNNSTTTPSPPSTTNGTNPEPTSTSTENTNATDPEPTITSTSTENTNATVDNEYYLIYLQ